MKRQPEEDKALPRGAARARRRAALGWAASLLVAGLCATGIAACTGALDSQGSDDGVEAAQASVLSIEWLPPDVNRYQGLFNVEAKRTGVDADLLALMVLAESGGDPKAKSPAGARGLMQLMPATARAVSARAGIPFGNDDELYEPALNLRLGAELVKELSAHFADKAPAERRQLVWSAYNAGSEAVERHLARVGVGLPDETERYVAFLGDLYGDKDLETSPHYDAWRKRVVTQRLKESEAPAPAIEERSRIGEGRERRTALELSLPHGSVVKAVLAGIVIEVDDATDGSSKSVKLKHRSGLTTEYSLLGSIAVKVGDALGQGDVVGSAADVGTSEPRFRFEIRDQGALLDPRPFLRLQRKRQYWENGDEKP